jgi:hypothetical protein
MNQQTKKQVATKNSTAVAAPTMDLSLVAKDAGQGLSEVNMDTIQIPFLKILSSMSPQTKKQKKEYIEGAEEGMIFNTVTEELIDGAEGITVVPCYFEPVALEWTDRGTGSSAPVAQHPVDTPLWHNHYCLLIDKDGLTTQVLISMKVSGLSKSRKWNSLVLSAKVKNGEQVINPPSWYFTYTLRTKPQTNEKGDWYGWDITRSNPVTPDIYAEGKAFNASVKKGDVEVNYEQEDTGSEKTDGENPF